MPHLPVRIRHLDELKDAPIRLADIREHGRCRPVDDRVLGLHHGHEVPRRGEHLPDFRRRQGERRLRIVLGEGGELALDDRADRRGIRV
ncbi:MAG: hypothetical protein IPK20_00975 [Betaproteobacteria bacterium]|nr:hypothetical protein [Betaproteobacteria bacterium]